MTFAIGSPLIACEMASVAIIRIMMIKIIFSVLFMNFELCVKGLLLHVEGLNSIEMGRGVNCCPVGLIIDIHYLVF